MWRSAVQVCLGLHSAKCESIFGGLAQLARALAWHARGHRFESDILHSAPRILINGLCMKKEPSFFDILTHKTVKKLKQNVRDVFQINPGRHSYKV